MPVVIVQPKHIELEVEVGETVFDGARRLGYTWPTVCGGFGTCLTCYMTVDVGMEHLSPVSTFEREGLERLGLAEQSCSLRLACQAKILGDAVVIKRGVRTIRS